MRTRRTFALVALCLTVAVLAVGFASATHVNEASEVPTAERTGIGFLDQFLELVLGPANEQIEEVNRETEDERSEPQIPAVFYHESFEDPPLPPHSWGQWAPHSQGEDAHGFTGWRLADEAAAHGEQGIWFGDEHGYPTPEDGVAMVGFVSPRINLSSLPVEGSGRDARAPQTIDTPQGSVTLPPDTGRAGAAGTNQTSSSGPMYVTAGGQEGTTPVDRIMLSIQHRFNLAFDQGDIHENDTAYVAVHPGGPPAGERRVMSDYDGSPLSSVSGGTSGSLVQFRPGTGFTGTQPGFQESRFDLTRFAGEEIHLVFWVEVQRPAQGDLQFTSDALFDTGAGFYGWQIDEVLIEGPARQHNVIVDEIEHPYLSPDETQDGVDRVVAPGADQPPLSAVLINRGQFTETVTAELELASDEGTHPCEPKTFANVPPGWTREISFDCTQDPSILEDGTTYDVTLRAHPDTDDGHEDDNEITLAVRSERAAEITATPLTVTPGVDDTVVPRTIKLLVRNEGNGFETADVELTVQRNVSALDPADEHWETVTQDVLRPGQSANRTLQLEPREVRTLAWEEILLEDAGAYRVYVNGSLDLPDAFDPTPGEGDPTTDPASFSRRTSAGTLIAKPEAYKTSFDPTQEVDEEAVYMDLAEDSAWTPRLLAPGANNPPPCPVGIHEDKCTPQNRTVWELPRYHDGGCEFLDYCTGSETWVLSGSVDGETVPEASQALRQVEAFRVTITHALTIPDPSNVRNHRVSLSLDGSQDEFTRDLKDQLPSSPVSVDGDSPGVNLGSSADGILQVYPASDSTAGSNSTPDSRLAYHGGQWVTETFEVSAHELVNRSHSINQLEAEDTSDAVQGLPTSLLSELTLRLQGGTSNYDECGKGKPPEKDTLVGGFDCSEWVVAEVEVLGMVADASEDASEQVRLIRWNGTGNQTGEWANYTSTGGFGSVNPALSALAKERRGLDCTYQGVIGEERPEPQLPVSTGDIPIVPPLQEQRKYLNDQCMDPGWITRTVEQLGRWEVVNESYADEVWLFDDASGTWSSGNKSRQLGMLTSPALKMPGDANAPTLRFHHSYDFGGGDTGRLMVRVLGPAAGDDLHLDAPFLPVAKDWADTNLTRALGDDAVERNGMQLLEAIEADEELQLPHALPEASDHAYKGSSEEDRLTEAIDLDAFPLLNHTGLDASLDGTRIGMLGDQDLEALRVVDLTEACDGPCVVQFGFRTETLEDTDGHLGWDIHGFEILREERVAHDLAAVDASLGADYDWRQLGLGPGTDVTLSVDAVNRGLFAQPPATGSEGDADIRVNATWLEADTDQAIATAAATVEGERLEPDASGTLFDDLTLAVPDPVDGAGTYKLLVCVELAGTLPGGLEYEDGSPDNDCLALGLNINGEEQIQANLGPHDGDSTGLPTLPVAEVADLALEDLDITPEVGVAGSRRQVDVTVNNTGNVLPSSDAVSLGLTFQHFDEDDRVVKSWEGLRAIPVAGQQSPFVDLLRLDAGGLPGWVTLQEEGRYLVEATIEGPGFADTVQTTVENRNALYAESFERDPWGTLADGDRIAPDDEPSAWETAQVTTPGGGTETAWNFGDALRSTYPDTQTDESLRLPSLDVSTAKSGSLALTHRYTLEDRFDGARVEASLDGGETWFPITPEAGYPGNLSADNPMNPDNDPLRDEPAWTSSSHGWRADEFDLSRIEALSSLSVIEEFRLDAFQGFDKDDIVDGILPPGHEGPQAWPSFQTVSFSGKWSSESHPSCKVEASGKVNMLEDCWYRENLRRGAPAPDPAHHAGETAPSTTEDGEFWWMGAQPWWNKPDDSSRYWTLLPLNVTLPAEENAEDASLSFWVWSGAVDMTDLIAPNGGPQPGCSQGLVPPSRFSSFSGCERASFLHAFDADEVREPPSPWNATVRDPNPSHFESGWKKQLVGRSDVSLEEEAGDWTRWSVDLDDAMEDDERTVRVEFLASRGWGTQKDGQELQSYRGLAIDDVQLEVTRADGQTKLSPADPEVEWGTVRTGCDNCPVPDQDDIGWHTTGHTFDVEEVWTVETVEDRLLNDRDAWVFGHPDGNGGFTYPANARERLVTPIIDLTEVAGSQASISFWEDRSIGGNGDASLLLQPLERTLGGQAVWTPAPWEPIGGPCQSEQHGWCQRNIDLEDYIGQKVRLGFEVQTDASGCGGCFWAVHDLQVSGELFVGDTLDLRLRAATDRSIGTGYWTVEDIQLAGFTYEDNVGVILDEDPGEDDLAPGAEHSYEGTVRNLAGSHREDLVLAATTHVLEGGPAGGDPVGPELELHGEGGNVTVDGNQSAALAVPINRAGGNQDEQRFRLDVSVPNDATEGAQHRISLDLLSFKGDLVNVSVLPEDPIQDENIEDHRPSVDVAVRTDLDIDDEPRRIDPPTVHGEGEAARLAVDLENVGTVPGAATVTFNVTNATGASVNVTRVSSPLIAPGDEASATWAWTPSEEDLAPGFYQVQYVFTESFGEDAGVDCCEPESIDPGDFDCEDSETDCDPVGVVLVDEQPLFFEERFEDAATLDETNWSSSQPCSPIHECWELRHNLGHSGNSSVHIGVNETQASQGQTYREQVVRLNAPRVNLTPLEELDWLQDDTPFNPSLGFHFRSLLAPGDRVQIQRHDRWETCGGDRNPWDTLGAIQAPDADEWRSWSASIGQDCGGPLPPNGNLRWVFAPNPDTPSWIGFDLDTVTVSAYRATMRPGAFDVALQPGADKHLHFAIENTGAAADTFQVRVDESLTSASAFDVEVLDPEVHLAPFEGSLATVAIAPAQDAPPNVVGRIVIEAVPTVDPNQAARSTIDVQLEERDQPNLVPRIERASGASGPVEEQDIVNFAATVQNTGAAASDPTDLLVQACPARADTTRGEDLNRCSEDANGEGFVTLLEAMLDEIEPLRDDPDAAATETVTWQVPRAEADAYHIVAEVDPENHVAEEDTSDNVAALTLVVDPLQTADVHVENFRVTHKGDPVHQASEGDVLRVAGEVTNHGNVPAENVGVTIQTRFPLLQQELSTLEPGETVTVSTQWPAEAGNWVLLFEALPGEGLEADLEDNLARWDLTVRSGGIHADADPARLEVAPGEQATAYLTLRNDRSAPASLTSEVDAPEGVQVTGLPPATQLPANGVSEHRLGVHVDHDAPPATGTLAFALRTNPDDAPVAQAEVKITIPHETELAYASDPVTASPAPLQVPVNVTNPAPEPQRVALDAAGPDAWTVQLPAGPVEIAPEDTRTVPVQVDVPAATPPATYELALREDGDLVHTVPVSITPTPAWSARITSTHETSQGREVFVHVENTGNADGLPSLETAGQFPHVNVDPPLATLGPGEGHTYQIRINAAGNGTLALAGTTITPEAGMDGARADAAEQLRIEELSLGSRTAPLPGERVEIQPQVVREGGSGSATVPVRLYVDGFLADEDELLLAPGQTGNATLSWTAEPGAHAFTVSAGDPDDATARTHQIDVPQDRQAPGAGALALAAALALGAVVARRGRARS